MSIIKSENGFFETKKSLGFIIESTENFRRTDRDNIIGYLVTATGKYQIFNLWRSQALEVKDDIMNKWNSDEIIVLPERKPKNLKDRQESQSLDLIKQMNNIFVYAKDVTSYGGELILYIDDQKSGETFWESSEYYRHSDITKGSFDSTLKELLVKNGVSYLDSSSIVKSFKNFINKLNENKENKTGLLGFIKSVFGR